MQGGRQGEGDEMYGKCDVNGIKKQASFCAELMHRLCVKLLNAKEGSWSGIADHCQTQDDIKRLRRELMELSKMLDPWRE